MYGALDERSRILEALQSVTVAQAAPIGQVYVPPLTYTYLICIASGSREERCELLPSARSASLLQHDISCWNLLAGVKLHFKLLCMVVKTVMTILTRGAQF